MDEIREDMNHRDLVQFLRARLDEDEAIAEANRSTFGPYGPHDVVTWEQHDYSGNVWWPDTNAMVATGQHGDLDDSVGKHIARHDPARVLREVAAKRALIAQDEGDPVYIYRGHAYVGDVLKCLAVSYADHPDYREEWRP